MERVWYSYRVNDGQRTSVLQRFVPLKNVDYVADLREAIWEQSIVDMEIFKDYPGIKGPEVLQLWLPGGDQPLELRQKLGTVFEDAAEKEKEVSVTPLPAEGWDAAFAVRGTLSGTRGLIDMDWTPGDANSTDAMTAAAKEGFEQRDLAPWVSTYIKQKLDGYCRLWNSSVLYTPVCSVFQSSGWGKSRNLCLLSERGVYVVYVSFQMGSGFPPRSPIANKLLSSPGVTSTFPLDHHYELQFTALVKACLEELSGSSDNSEVWLKKQFDNRGDNLFWSTISNAMDKQKEDCIREVQERVKEGMPFENAAEMGRKSFSADCLRLLDGRGPSSQQGGLRVLFIFDEARCLLDTVSTSTSKTVPFIYLRRAFREVPEGSGIFSVVTDTSSRLHYFQPPQTSDPSERALRAAEDSYAPIYLMGTLDIGVPSFGTNALTVDMVENPERVFKYGRPLWGLPYTVQDLIGLACSKLLGGGDRHKELVRAKIRGNKVQITEMEALALLGAMLALDITPQISVASGLVGSYLRTCGYISDDRSFMYTTMVVEPVLSEAAAKILYEVLKDEDDEHLLKPLIEMCKRGVVENGYRGELVGRIILLTAAHRASISKLSKQAHVKYSRVVTLDDFWRELTGVTLQQQIRRCKSQSSKKLDAEMKMLGQENLLNAEIKEKLELLEELKPEECHIYFNSFTPMVTVPTKLDLVKCFLRCVSIVCKRNQRGIDLVIPMVRGNEVREATITMIVIQIKNAADPNLVLNATAKLSPEYARFEGFEAGSTIPYIALYMGLDSSEDKENVPLKKYNTRRGHQPLARQIPIVMSGLSSKLYPCLASNSDRFAQQLRELRVSWADLVTLFKDDSDKIQYAKMFGRPSIA